MVTRMRDQPRGQPGNPGQFATRTGTVTPNQHARLANQATQPAVECPHCGYDDCDSECVQCANPDCDGLIDDGEGYDGYCGTCADQRADTYD